MKKPPRCGPRHVYLEKRDGVAVGVSLTPDAVARRGKSGGVSIGVSVEAAALPPGAQRRKKQRRKRRVDGDPEAGRFR